MEQLEGQEVEPDTLVDQLELQVQQAKVIAVVTEALYTLAVEAAAQAALELTPQAQALEEQEGLAQ
jgi:hypothetical protein